MSASFEECIQSVIEFEPTKLVISKPANKDYRFKKIVVERKKEYYQFARYTQKQVFHENVQLSNLSLQLNSILKNEFLQLDGWSESYEFHLLLSKKGAVTLKKKRSMISRLRLTLHTTGKRIIFSEWEISSHRWSIWVFLPNPGM